MSDDRRDLADLVRRQLDSTPGHDTGNVTTDAHLDELERVLVRTEALLDRLDPPEPPPSVEQVIATQLETGTPGVEALKPVTRERWVPGVAKRF